MKHNYADAISAITTLIRQHKSYVDSESHNPVKDCDNSDHYIDTHQKAVIELRKIRESLEDLESRKDYLQP